MGVGAHQLCPDSTETSPAWREWRRWHGRVYTGKKGWTLAYRYQRWLTTVRFDHPAQQVVL
ncbi:hypothetical protein [Magnetospirillum gryphiswaldense]|uniref:Uncharacterized protein n=1 Tax=Magnetospirillum gryphiswaldense TaxID=55518 RepID=A4TZ24_9PROT|nr:hypothetical protein [Magnetospirillum gryphiswaldense]CAM75881.1 hypothetical protein MGR_1538 [Magnetospirillum gryphiswaldense MSR-1]